MSDRVLLVCVVVDVVSELFVVAFSWFGSTTFDLAAPSAKRRLELVDQTPHIGLESSVDRRRGIQSARLQGARHQRQPRQQVVPGLVCHFPQAVMGREIAVVVAQRLQVRTQKLEVQGLLARDADPLAVERLGHAGEAPDDVQRQVDGVEFDVRQLHAAAWFMAWRSVGPAVGPIWRRRLPRRSSPISPARPPRSATILR